MATNKPRITITLEQRTYNVLKVISECGDKTMSGFVAELLTAAMPTLERMAVTFQAIQSAQVTERTKFLASLDKAQSALEPSVMQAVGQFDLFLATIDDAAQGRGAPARAGRSLPAAAEGNPRPVTRGSTPLPRNKSAAAENALKHMRRKASGLLLPLEKGEAESVAEIKAKIARQQGRKADAAEHEAYAKQEAKKRAKP